jgi:YhcH/YjgK/YiaL family protein
MILDTIDNARFYTGLHVRFAKAFEILKDKTLSQKDDGKYLVDGDNIYYTIQRYTTKPLSECKFEVHQKYIDIQVLLSGVEILGYTPVKELTVAEEYNPEKDIAFFEKPKEFTKLLLKPVFFCILFPDDAHLPGCCFEKPGKVRKAVIKIRI